MRIGNAPCSWGIEFASDPAYPTWQSVLLSIIGGVVFRPFHDASKWDEVLDASKRTCEALVAHGAEHLVLIDSISERRAPTAGRANEAEQMDTAEWTAFRDRIETIAKLGAEEYGLTVGMHAHAAGFMDFEPELERLLDEVDESILKICFDTGHHSYAGFDPVAFMKNRAMWISKLFVRCFWMPDLKAGVRWSRIAIRRFRARLWRMRRPIANTCNPSGFKETISWQN